MFTLILYQFGLYTYERLMRGFNLSNALEKSIRMIYLTECFVIIISYMLIHVQVTSFAKLVVLKTVLYLMKWLQDVA